MDEPSLKFGTNISHWLSQSTLDREIMKRCFTRVDMDRIAGWGMDHIRLTVDYPLIENDGWPGNYSEEGLGWIDRAIDWCESAGLWCVLDMHILPGHVFMQEYRAINTMFNEGSPTFKRACDLWSMLARRYRDRKVAFEVLNEPVAATNRLWNEYAASLHTLIRRESPGLWILVPSNEWDHAANFKDLAHFEDDKTIYTFHFYEPLLFTHQNALWIPFMKKLEGASVPYPGPFDHSILDLNSGFPVQFDFMKKEPYGLPFLESQLRPVLDFAKHYDAPVYCGEFGCITLAPPQDRLRWYADLASLFASHGIGFANWDYKSDDFGIVDCRDKQNSELLRALQEAAQRGRKHGKGTM